jgi:hypothetical protein
VAGISVVFMAREPSHHLFCIGRVQCDENLTSPSSMFLLVVILLKKRAQWLNWKNRKEWNKREGFLALPLLGALH